MLGKGLDRLVGVVMDHNRIVVVVLLLLTAGIAMGATELNTNPDTDDSDALGDTEVAQKQAYIEDRYAADGRGEEVQLNESERERLARTRSKTVYVHEPGGNVLSKASLLRTLRFQRTLRDDPAVGDLLDGRGRIDGVATLISSRAAGDGNATLDARIDALDETPASEVELLVSETLADESVATAYMPDDYEPGATTAESRRIEVRLAADGDTELAAARPQLQRADQRVYRNARAVTGSDYFTLDSHAFDRASTQQTNNTFQLIVPIALAIILAVLAFVYRDLVDILVGFTGVVVSVLWMFGILGWLQVPANAAIIVGPVLIVGLSVDYGLHVFMRYREQRQAATTERGVASTHDDGIRPSMFRSLRNVAVALALVTVTTAVGFAANLTNDFSAIRGLAVGISVGVVGSFVVFVTLVPALKIGIDGLLERLGLDRSKRPLGDGRVIRPLLLGGVGLARRAAPAVLVLALVVGTVGAGAWFSLDRQGIQQQQGEVAEWKQDLPDPIGWDRPDAYRHSDFVDEAYRSDRFSDYGRSQILVQGPVTDPGTLDQLAAAESQLRESEVFYRAGDRRSIISPLAAIEELAARDERAAARLDKADTDGDGIPDRNLDAVYDALYEVAPEQASNVIERTDGDEYASLRMIVLVKEDATLDERATAMQAAADRIEADSDLTATAVGRGTIVEAESIQTAKSILETLLIALVAVFVMLMIVYRVAEGSASLGAVTVLPIVLVTALLVGSMFLLDIPLTFVTALLVSLVVGLGIDYSIHISDRFAQELDDGADPHAALERAVTGTGGALLGSTLTSAGAFTAILLHPNPQIRSFGTLVVLALTLSFLVSVYVLPSILLLWHRHVRDASAAIESRLPDAVTSD